MVARPVSRKQPGNGLLAPRLHPLQWPGGPCAAPGCNADLVVLEAADSIEPGHGRRPDTGSISHLVPRLVLAPHRVFPILRFNMVCPAES